MGLVKGSWMGDPGDLALPCQPQTHQWTRSMERRVSPSGLDVLCILPAQDPPMSTAKGGYAPEGPAAGLEYS